MKKNIIFICLICLCAGNLVACNDFDNPEVPNGEAPEKQEPPTPPQIQASWNLEQMPNTGSQGANVFAYKDKKYDALFTRTLGWNGGDGVFTTALPDGNIYWSFNDSFYGVVDGETRARRSCNFPRNSIMIQTGFDQGQETDANLVWIADYVQTDNPDADRYYQVRTHLRHPLAQMPVSDPNPETPTIERGDIDNDYLYWAGDAVVYEDPVRGNVLQMLWIGVDLTAGGGSMVNFSNCLREYSLEGTPGDGQYMSELSINHDFKPDGFAYGSTMFVDKEEGHIYLYTTKQVGEGLNRASYVLVARTETLDLNSQWSYYICGLDGEFVWQTTLPTDEEQQRSYISTYSGSMPWVFEKDGTYYMTMEGFPFGRNINIYRSDKPYGPFVEEKLLFTLPATLDKIGNPYHQRWYMVNLHKSLSREGELVFSTNSDAIHWNDNFNSVGSADFYRPFFFRVFNWEHIYDEE